MVLGRLRGRASGDACQRVTGHRFSCPLLGFDHYRVNGTNAVHRPGGRAVSEKRTLSTDLLAFEKRFTSIDSFDDIECGDLGRGARERKATANSLTGDDDARLLKLGEKLRNKFGRDLLQRGKIARARRLPQFLRIDEEKQAVQSIFDTGAYMSHGTVQNSDKFSRR